MTAWIWAVLPPAAIALVVSYLQPHFEMFPPAGMSAVGVLAVGTCIKVLLLLWAGWRAASRAAVRPWGAAGAALCVWACVCLLLPGALNFYLRYFADHRYVAPARSFTPFLLLFAMFAPVALVIGWLGGKLASTLRRRHAT